VIVIRDGDFRDNTTFLVDDTNGEVQIYITHDLDVEDDSVLSSISQTPGNLSILSLGDVRFRDRTVFYGTVYAPNARVRVRDNAQFFGALMAEEARVRDDARVHFDEQLRYQDSGDQQEYESLLWHRLSQAQVDAVIW
jgi:hypothetical protein